MVYPSSQWWEITEVSRIPESSLSEDISIAYEWLDLETFHASGATVGDTTVVLTPSENLSALLQQQLVQILPEQCPAISLSVCRFPSQSEGTLDFLFFNYPATQLRS